LIRLAALATMVYCVNHKHPLVQADNNYIDIEVRENNDYFGPIYVGSQFSENHLIYDTMSDWTIIIGNDADNQG
jgi:hypothetical protein